MNGILEYFGISPKKVRAFFVNSEYTPTDCFFGDFAHWEDLYGMIDVSIFICLTGL